MRIKDIYYNTRHDSWKELDTIVESSSFLSDFEKLDNAYKTGKIFPPKENIFNVFSRDKSLVKVVIVGQDPYHTPGVAHGLAFSSNKSDYVPPSLRIIFKELERTGIQRTNVNLTDWADQGVFLLNTILTVTQGKPLSHNSLSWQELTKKSLELFDKEKVIFLGWGSHAQQLINKLKPKYFLKACHPQAENYGKVKFVGCNHFVETNELLLSLGESPIIW